MQYNFLHINQGPKLLLSRNLPSFINTNNSHLFYIILFLLYKEKDIYVKGRVFSPILPY